MSVGDSGSKKMIGGRIKDGETPRQAAIREAIEEGGVDLSNHHLYDLPYQSNFAKAPSYWFGVDVNQMVAQSFVAGDDVLALFWASIEEVESELSHEPWKEHWRNNILPALLGK